MSEVAMLLHVQQERLRIIKADFIERQKIAEKIRKDRIALEARMRKLGVKVAV